MNDSELSLSVVVPLRDEEPNVEPLGERLSAALGPLTSRWEVVFVDDGSRDATYGKAAAHEADARFKVVRLSRSFGHQVALSAGLDVAVGDAVSRSTAISSIRPRPFPALVERWREGAQVVYGVMVERQGEPASRTYRPRFYRALPAWRTSTCPSGAGDFRLVDRSALDAFR